jgi:general secretion pathway protein M
MKEYWVKFKEWHAQLEQRERRMVNIGGVAVAVAIFYFGIWSPFLGRVAGLRSGILGEQKTLAWMQSADQKIKGFSGENSGKQQKMTPVTMLSLLQNQVNQSGMKDSLTLLKQAANDSIQMQFKHVSFDQLMKLLIAVIKANHINITQFNAAAEGAPGIVNAELMISLD